MEKVNEARLLTSTSSSLTEYFLKVSKAPSKSGLVMISLKRATTFMPKEIIITQRRQYEIMITRKRITITTIKTTNNAHNWNVFVEISDMCSMLAKNYTAPRKFLVNCII